MKAVLALLLLLLSGLPAHPQKDQPLPPNLPPFGPERLLQIPEVNQVKLENGLTIWMVPRPGFPKLAFTLAVSGGSVVDPGERPGLAQLLAATISQGTQKRNARVIAETIQEAGGDLTCFALRDAILLSSSVLEAKSSQALELLADVAQNATFPDAEIALAKHNLSEQLDQLEADPSFLASRALTHVLFGDTPYGRVTPTKTSIAATDPAELRREFLRRFRPDQSILVIVGNFRADTILSVIRTQFGAWRRPETPPIEFPSPPSRTAPHSLFIVPRAGSVQTTLSLGGFVPLRGDSDFEAVEVANAIYGGTFGSRLTSNLREDKGYTYTPGSFLQLYRSAGLLRTRADVRNEVTGASFNEIVYELNRMSTTQPGDRELQQAKQYLLGDEALRLQSLSAIVGELTDLWTKRLSPGEIGKYGEKISAVTAAEVQAVSRKYFPASRMSIVAVGEEEVIREALHPFELPISAVP